jgi:anthranilate phosphoribosyltransferase
VADARIGELLAGVLAGRGSSALVFHGDDGLDELTTTTTSAVWLVHGAAVTATEFDPAELGLPRARPEQLRGGDATHNAAVMRAVLGGETGPVRDIVLLNAAAALAADAGVARAEDLSPVMADGLARAAEAVDSGAAAGLLDRWIAASQRLAGQHKA